MYLRGHKTVFVKLDNNVVLFFLKEIVFMIKILLSITFIKIMVQIYKQFFPVSWQSYYKSITTGGIVSQ